MKDTFILTNYRKAWLDFKRTADYKRASNALKNKGIVQPYRDNILMTSFAAGWNATGNKIKLLDHTKKK